MIKDRKFAAFDNGIVNLDKLMYVEKIIDDGVDKYKLYFQFDNEENLLICYDSLEELEANFFKLKKSLLGLDIFESEE